MSKRLLNIGVLSLFFLTGLASQPVWGHDNDFNAHWLAAACTQVPVGGRLSGRVVETEFGIAVEPRAGRTLVLYCNIEADLFHNLIQLIAEDDSPNVRVTATLFQQNIHIPGPPTAIATVTTGDQAGLQVADFFVEPAIEPNEFNFMYFMKIEVVRRNTDPVRVYSVSLRDVL